MKLLRKLLSDLPDGLLCLFQWFFFLFTVACIPGAWHEWEHRHDNHTYVVGFPGDWVTNSIPWNVVPMLEHTNVIVNGAYLKTTVLVLQTNE